MSSSSIERLAKETPQAAAALALADVVDAVDNARAVAEGIAPKVWHFASTADARAAVGQDLVADGDVLVVDSEQVVAFVAVIYPVAITEQRGALLAYEVLRKPARDYCQGSYVPSVERAEQVAIELGFPLADPDAARAARAGTGQPVPGELPRMLVEAGDVLHEFGARLRVIDTGTRIAAGGRAEWWALVEGVTAEDSRRTHRGQWAFAVPVETAAWDVVTVARATETPTA